MKSYFSFPKGFGTGRLPTGSSRQLCIISCPKAKNTSRVPNTTARLLPFRDRIMFREGGEDRVRERESKERVF